MISGEFLVPSTAAPKVVQKQRGSVYVILIVGYLVPREIDDYTIESSLASLHSIDVIFSHPFSSFVCSLHWFASLSTDLQRVCVPQWFF